jgi:tetratricopeptide (TPR) repeat protein
MDQGALPRDRLFPPTSIAALAATVGVVLYAIFPHTRELSDIAAQARNDGLALQYLRNLVRATPGDLDLKMLLIKQEMALRHFAVARAMLEDLRTRADPEHQHALDLLLLRTLIGERDFGSHRTAAGDARLRQEIHQILVHIVERHAWSSEGFDLVLGEILNDPQPAPLLSLLRQRAEVRSGLSAHHSVTIAERLLGRGHYEAAAEFYLLAARQTPAGDGRQRLFFDGLAALQAGSAFQTIATILSGPVEDYGTSQDFWVRLARVALASGHPALAERFIKRGLKMALLRQVGDMPGMVQPVVGTRALHNGFLRVADTGLDPNFIPGKPPAADFDEETFRFGYDVFLANRNLNDAFLLAQRAVKERPNDAAWRRRYAQVARWLAKPDLALEQWLAAARLGDQAAWQDVATLAPTTWDAALKVAAMEALVEHGDTSPERIDQLIAAYDNAARPEAAVAVLDRLYSKHREPRFLVRKAEYQRHLGDASGEADTLERLIAAQQGNTPVILRLAANHLERRDSARALAVLARAAPNVTDHDTAFWRLYAQVAAMRQDDALARIAYRKALLAEKPPNDDLRAYFYLVRDHDAAEARRIAELAWTLHRDNLLFLNLLELESLEGAWPTLARRITTLNADDHQALAGEARYWSLRATIWQQTGQPERAIQDYQEAVRLAPGDENYRVGLLWLLIDLRRTDLLQTLIERWTDAGRQGGPLASAMGSALLTLGRPQQALQYYLTELKRLRRTGQEPDRLWLFNYAEVLDQAGRRSGDIIRRYLWRDLLRSVHDDPQRFRRLPVEAERAARLALSETSGDVTAQVFRRLLEPAGLDATASLQRAELIQSWLLRDQRYDTAAYVQWKLQAARLNTPAYLTMLTALNREDGETAARLLAKQAEAVPIYDRVYGARLIGDLTRERDEAAAGLANRPDDETLHLQLSEAFFRRPAWASQEVVHTERGALQRTTLASEVSMPFGHRKRVTARWQESRQATRDPLQLVNPPGGDYRWEFEYAHEGDAFKWRGVFGHRVGRDGFDTSRLETVWQPWGWLSFNASFTNNEPADDNLLLSIAGHKEGARLGTELWFGRREYLRIGYGGWYYQTQGGEYLGMGRQVDWEAGYRLRLDAPDVGVRLNGLHARYSRDGQVPLRYLNMVPGGYASFAEDGELAPFLRTFLPNDSDQYTLSMGYGETNRSTYRNKLVPFGNAGLIYNTETRWGYTWTLGITSSLAGALPDGVDRLTAYIGESRGARPGGDRTREAGLQWQYWFEKPPR